MNMKRMVLSGVLGLSLISPTAIQCNNTKMWLGMSALLTGAVSYTFFEMSGEQSELLNKHNAFATQFRRVKKGIDDLKQRLAKQKESHGADIKMKQESESIKTAINTLYNDHSAYIVSYAPLNIRFQYLSLWANKPDLTADASAQQQKAAEESLPVHARNAANKSAYSLFKGWFDLGIGEADKVNIELEERARVLQARRTLASRWGTACAGFGIACAAALLKLHYWPTARA